MRVVGIYGGPYNSIGQHLEPTRPIELAEILQMCLDEATRAYVLARLPSLAGTPGPCWLFPARLGGRHQLWLVPCECKSAHGHHIEGEIDLAKIILPETKFGWISPIHPFDASLKWEATFSVDAPSAFYAGKLALTLESAALPSTGDKYVAVNLPHFQLAFDVVRELVPAF
ncbi:MAG: hypothetical protein FJ014_20270 [Chloroflexi bacterium]|nr:hypothetical protein [Chloroflexota bacterium]